MSSLLCLFRLFPDIKRFQYRTYKCCLTLLRNGPVFRARGSYQCVLCTNCLILREWCLKIWNSWKYDFLWLMYICNFVHVTNIYSSMLSPSFIMPNIYIYSKLNAVYVHNGRTDLNVNALLNVNYLAKQWNAVEVHRLLYTR